MNDTNKLQEQILELFNASDALSSSDVHIKLGEVVSLVTIKRYLSSLTSAGFLGRTGGGRSIIYSRTKKGVMLCPINVDAYLAVPQTQRDIHQQYNHTLFTEPYVPLFDAKDLALLDSATRSFQHKSNENQEVHARELQRFIVDMSWKSAQIEGNTYSLLDTEQLLTYGIKSRKNTEFETQMILNQKAAFDFLYQNNSELRQSIPISFIEKVHEYVIDGLGVARNLRRTLVGITGTNYKPIGNQFQIREALEQLLRYVSQAPNVYEKALLLTLSISYIQPFVDGNKRTSRMIANGVLLAAGHSPISYLDINEGAYKSATLIFYEQNSIQPLKELFIEQYIYSAGNYNIATPTLVTT